MEILFSEEFRKDFKKIKDKALRLRIIKHIRKLKNLPKSGKPLRYVFKNYRTIRIPPFRIIYKIEQNRIIIICFDHRKTIYESSKI